MTTIKLTVSGAKATAIVDGVLTSGSVGIPVTIEYDSIWDGLAKNLMCATGKWHPAGAPKAIINIDGSAAVAPEALIADNHLYLGVEGRNADGTLVICSTWADCGTVFAGADTNADPSVQPTAPVWAQLRAEIEQLKIPTVSDAQIETALDLYFERNPIKIPDGPENGCPLTTEQITTLDNMFKVCAFTKADVSAEYRSFCTAFGIEDGTVPDEPDGPAVTLTSISATYNGGKVSVGTPVNALSGIVVTARYSDGSTARVSGYTLSGTIKEGSNTITVTYQGKTATFTVYGEVVAEKTLESISATYSGGPVPVGTAVSALSGIVVTAYYSDGASKAVTGYTLSGTIAEGSNTVTVTYQGKTATFTVTGVAESGVSNETTWSDGVAYTYTPVENVYVETDGSFKDYNGWSRTPYLYCDGAAKLRSECVGWSSSIAGASGDYSAFYDADKNYISSFNPCFTASGVMSALGDIADIEIPANAVYFIFSHKNNVMGIGHQNGPYLKLTPYA